MSGYCSQWKHPIERVLFEPVFYMLIDELGIDDVMDFERFENDTFIISPYYWGECTCGWDFVDGGHMKIMNLEHRPECYQTEYRLIDHLSFHDHHEFLSRLKKIYEKYGWETESEGWWHGCAAKCTCDYYDRESEIYEEYARDFGHYGCKPDCELEKPNFFHKPTGYGLQWYKYPLRGGRANREISVEEFSVIVSDCIDSLRR